MTTMRMVARRAVLAGVVAGSLGFGAVQALARPAEAQAAARACTAASCDDYCKSRYGPEAIGRCSTTGFCRCLY